MNVFDLVAKLSLDSSEYDKGLDNSENKASSFGDKLKGGLATAGKIGAAAVGALAGATMAAGAALVKGTGEVAAYGDNIDKMSQKMGISAEAYQEWDAILQHSGSSIDAMSRGMMTLQKNAVNSADKFEQLGITQEQLASMSTEELFSATISGLQEMGEGAERTALANELLGGSAKELGALLNTSAEDTEAMRQRVHELGGVMSDEAVKAAAAYQDSLQDMQTAFSGLKRNLISDFMPGIKGVMDGLTSIFSGDSKKGLGQISSGISSVIDTVTKTLPKFIELGSTVVLSLVTAISENLPSLLSTGADAIMTIGAGLLENLPAIVESGLQVIVSLATGIAESLPKLIPTIVDVVLQIVDTLTDPDTLVALVEASIAIIIALAEGLIEALPKLLEKAPVIVANLVTAVVKAAPKLLSAAWELITTLAGGISDNLGEMAKAAGRIISTVLDGLRSLLGSFASVGGDIVRGIWKGISDGYGWIKGKIESWVGDVVGFFKRILGIASPSKVFAQMGDFMAQGVGVGIEGGIGDVEKAVADMSNAAVSAWGTPELAAGFSSSGSFATATGGSYGGNQRVSIGFDVDMEGLVRYLRPYIKNEDSRIGAAMVV